MKTFQDSTHTERQVQEQFIARFPVEQTTWATSCGNLSGAILKTLYWNLTKQGCFNEGQPACLYIHPHAPFNDDLLKVVRELRLHVRPALALLGDTLLLVVENEA